MCSTSSALRGRNIRAEVLCEGLMMMSFVRTEIGRSGFDDGEVCGSSRNRVIVPLGFKVILRWRKGSMGSGEKG